MIYRGIKALLDQTTGLGEFVGDRIFPVVAPQNTPLPVVIYEIPSVKHCMHLRGGSGLGRAILDVACFAEDPGGFVAVRQMKELIRLRMTNFKGESAGIQIRGITSDNEEGVDERMEFIPPQDESENGVHVCTLTFMVSYVEPNPGD